MFQEGSKEAVDISMLRKQAEDKNPISLFVNSTYLKNVNTIIKVHEKNEQGENIVDHRQQCFQYFCC